MHPLPRPDPPTISSLTSLMRPLMHYHHHRVVGMENVPLTGACLMVVHHSMATYDGFLLGIAIHDATGRLGRALGDDRIFQTPMLGPLAERCGIVPASPGAGEALLAAGELVGVAPGGMWESLRPFTERRTVRWGDRRGFCRLALKAGAPLLLAACPAADDLYKVYPSRITDAVYERLHLPLPLLRGVGPTLAPRKIALTHHLAPLIQPPPYEPAREGEQVEALFQQALTTMEGLLRR